MVYINSQGYLEKRTGKCTTRNWWLVKYHNRSSGTLGDLNRVFVHVKDFPEYLGKRVRFKVEVIEENGK